MNIEHFAINVDEPRAMAAWYVEHMDFTIARKVEEPPYMHFLADSNGNVMLEIYNNPTDQVPDYSAMDPLLLHLALVSEDPTSDKQKLIDAGASLVNDTRLEDGTHLVMLRDPWGLALQLCKRATPMI